jgi:hypothetical protein
VLRVDVARQSSGALVKTNSTYPSLIGFSQIFETKVGQVLNSKVVDQLTLYNFYKGRIGF